MGQKSHLGIIGAGVAVKKAQSGIGLFDTVSITHLPDWHLEYPGSYNVFDDISDLIADSGCDGLYIATPVAAHQHHIHAALTSKLPTLVEKPMLLSSSQEELFRDYDKSKVRVAFKKRYSLPARLIKSTISAKPRGGASLAMRWFAPYPGDKHWKLDKAMAGGGILMDVGTHMLDMARFCCGSINVSAVREIRFDAKCETESYFSITCTSQSGVSILLEGGWESENSFQEIRFWDGDSAIDWRKDDQSTVQRLSVRSSAGRSMQEVRPDEEYRLMFQQFLGLCWGQQDDLPTWMDGIENLRAIEEIFELVRVQG
ncbi:Gfo/Idh/MocA family protein [Erythrobacter sp. GH1-10]|uniref:Gfo/Idh/MocA family protein n=1 Tax=Erythrobacter sp. GH1-10 TaxID=3349334 RepID=UPI003877C5F5